MLKVQSIIKRHAKGYSLLLMGLLVGIASSSLVFASVPDTSGAVHACYKTGGLLPNGAVRFIDNATQSCNGTETEVKLNKATPGNFLTNLVGADFTDASLSYRNFTGQDMHGSIFTHAALSGADFSNANLSSSTFGDGIAPGIGARKVNLANTNLSSSNFAGNIDLTGTIFENTNLHNTNWGGSVTGGDFRHAIITGAYFSAFNGSDFRGVDFSVTADSGMHTVNSLLQNTKFSTTVESAWQFDEGTNLTNATLDNLTFREYSFIRNAIVTGASFRNVHFQNTDLLQTDFSGAILTGATWTNTRCPDGTNSDNNGNTCIGHLVP